MENKRPPPISGIRADNRRFHNLFASLTTRSLTQELCKSYRNFLSRCSSCLGGILGWFFRDGCIISLSCVLGCPCFPLGISVEIPVLEIAGLESGSGLKMGLSGILGLECKESGHV